MIATEYELEEEIFFVLRKQKNLIKKILKIKNHKTKIIVKNSKIQYNY